MSDSVMQDYADGEVPSDALRVLITGFGVSPPALYLSFYLSFLLLGP